MIFTSNKKKQLCHGDSLLQHEAQEGAGQTYGRQKKPDEVVIHRGCCIPAVTAAFGGFDSEGRGTGGGRG